MVSKDHDLSVRRQCGLLSLARSNLYCQPKGESGHPYQLGNFLTYSRRSSFERFIGPFWELLRFPFQ